MLFVCHVGVTHPCALSSNKLVIFCLDAGAATGVIVFLLKVRVIFKLFWSLKY